MMVLPISDELQSTQPAPIILGNLIKRFPPNRRNISYLVNLLAIITCLVGAMVTLAFGLNASISSASAYGPQITWKILQLPLATSLVLLLLGVIFFLRLLWVYNQSIELYQHGLVWMHHNRSQPIPWQAIDKVLIRNDRSLVNVSYQELPTWCRITSDNRTLILDVRLTEVSDLIETVQCAIYPNLYKKYAELYNQGIKLSFGPINLDKATLVINKSRQTWDCITPCKVDQGYLVVPIKIGSKTEIMRLPTSRIENFQILVAILKYLLKWQGE